MPITYRPQPLWVVWGPLIGIVSGFLAGVLVLSGLFLSDPLLEVGAKEVVQAIGMSLVLGGIYGAASGFVVGLAVGLPLVLLVGRHLTRSVARRRAYALGTLLPPVALAAGFVLVTGDPLSWPQAEELWWLAAPLGAAALGGPLAAWAAGSDRRTEQVS